jgi:hypothetical protein
MGGCPDRDPLSKKSLSPGGFANSQGGNLPACAAFVTVATSPLHSLRVKA